MQLWTNDLQTFLLLLRNKVTCYDYINSWDIVKQKPLPLKESSYCELNTKRVSNNNCRHARRV